MPAHPFALALTPVIVSRYRTPSAAARRLLLHNDRHLDIAVLGSNVGRPLFLNYMSMLYKAVRKWAKKVGPVSYAELTNVS